MSLKKEVAINNIEISGASVSTATGQVIKGSKAESTLELIGSIYQERQLAKRAKEVALILMDELEIPDNASIVGYLCGGTAKSNVKEITDWVLRVTANSIDGSEIYDSEFIHDLSLHLLNILMEVQHDYYR
ncbi:hypothetical protein [Altibacter sp.]|uniref:hypothetical protein n=1 Tax=Altibacter sp. TaxID=2024823 RepID=UPI002589084F|nr:hypothetical protein [Altibacter sp.]MCW8899067.1 hypothetical protein [Gammaproteobacteria bacterium]MCW8981994.1 hypothetical protein [Altibacter sp.]MCW9038353.1 hypothetical protein [Altibacter sp.]